MNDFQLPPFPSLLHADDWAQMFEQFGRACIRKYLDEQQPDIHVTLSDDPRGVHVAVHDGQRCVYSGVPEQSPSGQSAAPKPFGIAYELEAFEAWVSSSSSLPTTRDKYGCYTDWTLYDWWKVWCARAGHSSLADMIAGHIPVWRKALEYCRAATVVKQDISYYDHEIKALEAIDAAILADRAAGGEQRTAGREGE